MITLERAIEILELKGTLINNEIIRKTYNGLIIMQQINIARDYLSTFTDEQLLSYSRQNSYNKHKEEYYKNEFEDEEEDDNFDDYDEKPDEEIYDDINIFRSYGLNAYCIGTKIIIEGRTYNYKEELKSRKFRWDPDKKIWWKYR